MVILPMPSFFCCIKWKSRDMLMKSLLWQFYMIFFRYSAEIGIYPCSGLFPNEIPVIWWWNESFHRFTTYLVVWLLCPILFQPISQWNSCHLVMESNVFSVILPFSLCCCCVKGYSHDRLLNSLLVEILTFTVCKWFVIRLNWGSYGNLLKLLCIQLFSLHTTVRASFRWNS